MFGKTMFLAALVAVVVVFTGASKLSATPFASPSAGAAVESYWTCPDKYAFEVASGNAVHCKKPAWTETRKYVGCTGLFPTTKIDLVGATDMCAGSGLAGVATSEPICSLADVADGFRKRYVSGTDFCAKDHPAEVIAPNTRVTR